MSAVNQEGKALHHIVVVGGGAGGLELATRLGDQLGKHGKAMVTLVDKYSTHMWKPLLHEVAAGSMDMDEHEIEYIAQGYWHHFNFRLGALEKLDRSKQIITLSPTYDEDGKVLIPDRQIHYDTLIIAVGSVSNDYGIPGVQEYAVALETQAEAATFHRRLINACIRTQVADANTNPGHLNVAIIGGGATGVELSAELHNTTRQLATHGLDNINPDRDVKLTIIEAAPRILPALPEDISLEVQRQLQKLNVGLELGQRVTKVDAQGVHTEKGLLVAASLVVWAAGIKAPDFLKTLDGLETNWANQLVVKTTLQTSNDDNIFALGDCAACPWTAQGKDAQGRTILVPARAQAAHQQASMLIKTVKLRIKGKTTLPEYSYRDFGSLVSLGKYSTVGNLMGGLTGGKLFIQGSFAGLMYRMLYKMHLFALHGLTKVVLDTIAQFITRRSSPHVKLH